MLEQLEPGYSKRSREFRAKFPGLYNFLRPFRKKVSLGQTKELKSRDKSIFHVILDDIMTDNLAGQLWFGAECLAAGSSILHKETESEQV